VGQVAFALGAVENPAHDIRRDGNPMLLDQLSEFLKRPDQAGFRPREVDIQVIRQLHRLILKVGAGPVITHGDSKWVPSIIGGFAYVGKRGYLERNFDSERYVVPVTERRKYYTVAEAAPILGLDGSVVRKRIAQGRFETATQMVIKDRSGRRRPTYVILKTEVRAVARQSP